MGLLGDISWLHRISGNGGLFETGVLSLWVPGAEPSASEANRGVVCHMTQALPLKTALLLPHGFREGALNS